MSNVILRVKDEDNNVYDLDINSSEPILFEISTIENAEIGKVYGVSSNQFSLPGTPSNNRFFGHIFNLGAVPNLGLVHSIWAQILVDGDAVFTGRLFLEDVVTDQEGYTMYNVTITDELVDFKSQVNDLTIADLDWSRFNHAYNYANISSSWGLNLFSGSIYYPFIDYGIEPNLGKPFYIGGNTGTGLAGGINTNAGAIDYEQFKPSLRLKDYVDVLFAATDYNYTSSWLNSDEVKNYYILPCNPSYNRNGTDSLLGVAIEGASGRTKASLTSSFALSASYFANPVTYYNTYFSNESYDTNPVWDAATNRIVVTSPIVTSITVKYHTTITSAAVEAQGVVQFFCRVVNSSGTVIDTEVVVISPNSIGQEDDLLFVFSNLALPAGTYHIQLGGRTSNTFNQNQAPVAVTTWFTVNSGVMELVDAWPAAGTAVVDLSLQFGRNNKAVDYFQAVLEKFNLIVEPLPNDPATLLIEPYDDWIAMGDSDDWSEMVDDSQRITIYHPIKELPQKIRFSDEDDIDDLNEWTKTTYELTYGERELIAGSDIATGDKQIGKLFAATPVAGVPGKPSLVLPHLNKIDDQGVYRPIQFKPRLLQRVTGSLGTTPLVIKDESGDFNVITGTYFTLLGVNAVNGEFADGFDLHFNNNGFWHYQQPDNNGLTVDDVYYRYWSKYINSLYDYDARKLVCNVTFYPSDVKYLRRNNRYFYKGHYWRINKISGVSITEPSNVQVELLKLLDIEFKFPRKYIGKDLVLAIQELKEDGSIVVVNPTKPTPPPAPCYEGIYVKTGGSTTLAVSKDATTDLCTIASVGSTSNRNISFSVKNTNNEFPAPGTVMDVTVTLNSAMSNINSNFFFQFGGNTAPATYFNPAITTPQTISITWGAGAASNQLVKAQLPGLSAPWTGYITVDFDGFGVCP